MKTHITEKMSETPSIFDLAAQVSWIFVKKAYDAENFDFCVFLREDGCLVDLYG